jgi:hypothetical protein
MWHQTSFPSKLCLATSSQAVFMFDLKQIETQSRAADYARRS